MWIYADNQTEPGIVDVDRDAIPAGFKAALKARLLAQGPMRMPDAVTWGINWCASQAAPNVMPQKVRNKIESCMADWHPAPVVEP